MGGVLISNLVVWDVEVSDLTSHSLAFTSAVRNPARIVFYQAANCGHNRSKMMGRVTSQSGI